MTIVLLSTAAVLTIVLGLAAWHVRSLLKKKPDYAQLPAHYPFKSPKTQGQYLSYCDARAKEWPTPLQERHIETAYGRTFVRTCGKEGAPPLVLLPSGFASSLIWLPNLAGLAPHFKIHAVDNIYDVGRSVNTRPVTHAGHLTEWLDELIAKLEPQGPANLMGLSFGGWLASQYALRHPERLHKVVLAAPAATLFPLPAAWAWRAILGVLPPRRFCMTLFLTNWMCQGLAKRRDARSKLMLDRWLDDAMMAMKCFAFRMPIAPTVLTDEELQSFRVPVLVAVGEHEVVYPADRAIQRIKTVAPAIATELFQDVGHDLTIAATDRFNQRIAAFLLG